MENKTFYLNSSFEAKALSKNSKSIKIAGYANTTTKDRAGDVVTAEAWAKGVANFLKNPVMLYQHKHDCPIGRFDKVTVDKKGIYVEGTVSEAAEKNHGIHTLIKDGALKSFSVGFQIKDGKYNKHDDTTLITEVELLEISVVSVPCNQDSLFSLRKSFETQEEYKSFITTLPPATDLEIKMMHGIKAGITDIIDGHYHTIEVDDEGNGVTTYASHMENHAHRIVHGNIMEADGHIHSITMIGIPTCTEEDAETINERPLSPSELETMAGKAITDSVDKTIALDGQEKAEDDDEIIDFSGSIPFINLLAVDTATIKTGDFINYEEKSYKVVDIPTAQNPIFKFLEVDVNGEPCDNTINVNIQEILQSNKINKTISEDTVSVENTQEALHEDSTKENDKMAEQVVETIDLSSKEAQAEVIKSVATVAVSEPRVAALVEKTGEAILREGDAKDKSGGYTPRESEQVEELLSQISKYKEQIKSHQDSKMHYSDNSRSSKFSEKEMANAVFLAKALNRNDVFGTKYGAAMKAVTSVDAFLSNFSSNIYTEMEQQLVIAPMFNRITVDAKTFRIPVSDEDTDGDVAMFKSGTFATGIADTTNVPVSNQNSISSVDFTPHKFMATTHLAKDEEEDTVLPLIDFLRLNATRRLARALDKSILRGTGALTGFTASPTNTIAAGTGYSSVIKGVTALAASGSLAVATGNSTDKVDPSDIAAARSAMGKYGLQLGNDLVFVTTIEGYNNLVTTSDFRTVDKFGPNATYLTGSVGAVYGIPIVISEFLDVVGTTGNNLGALIYKPGFLIAERRGIEIESEYEPRQQVTAMYMSTRFDFKALTTNASAALDATRYAYAVNINAG